jgi:hypothetical protein
MLKPTARSCLTLLFALTWSATARAQENTRALESPWGELLNALLIVESDGLVQVGPIVTGALTADETPTHSISSSDAGDYVVIGVCGSFCRSLDLTVKSEDSAISWTVDDLSDPMSPAIVRFPAHQRMKSTVTIDVGKCESLDDAVQARCPYAFGLYRVPPQ